MIGECRIHHCSVPFQAVRPDLAESSIATTVEMVIGSIAATVTCTRLAPPKAGSSIVAAYLVALYGTTNITSVLASRAPAGWSTDLVLVSNVLFNTKFSV